MFIRLRLILVDLFNRQNIDISFIYNVDNWYIPIDTKRLA